MAVFVALTLWAEASPISLPRGGGSVSVSFWPIYASTLLWGPSAGAWVAAIGTIRMRELRGHISLDKVLFNRGQLALSAGMAGLVYVLLGGVPGVLDLNWSLVLPLAACGLTYFVVNLTAVVLAMAIAQGVSIRDMWLTNFRWVIPQYVLLTPLAVFLAYVYKLTHVFGALMFMAPFLAARYSMQLYQDMRQDYLSTISALIQAVEAKDPYTRGHSEAVRRYTLQIAKEMRLAADVTERLEYASLLHDIGKIGVAESILRKPGRLTDEEYMEIKAHPAIGANIVQKLRLLGQEAGTVRSHHEWANGRGYPDGLTADRIPLGARIIAVADAYDAMTSDRPYRRTMSRTEAIAELRRCSGSQFDPAVVDAMIRSLARQEAARPV
jgi:putative nucleotidyltransferase with HDIG domain